MVRPRDIDMTRDDDVAALSETVSLAIPGDRSILAGAELGQKTREALKLDEIDRSPDVAITVRIPMSAVVTSSFIRGLVEPSVRELGYERFTHKYGFDAAPSVRDNILINARLAAREDTTG